MHKQFRTLDCPVVMLSHVKQVGRSQQGLLLVKEQPQKRSHEKPQGQEGWRIGAGKAPLPPGAATRRRSQAGVAPTVPSTTRQATAAEVEPSLAVF